jgi:secondary thiamine-phosphate synthase enzyme
MAVYQQTLNLQSIGADLCAITDKLNEILVGSGLSKGVLSVFCQHTSCSLVIMENADPSARHDLVAWLNRLVPENDPEFTHTFEGADDMPSHIKMALTRTSESVPFSNTQLLLGTWQGVFLWEHRRRAQIRRLIVTVTGE